ncbi:retrovirus-related pol polyprotein from transposon TNT 1-94 [Tanacetum coccineum]
MEESLFRQFKGGKHKDMLTIGQGTLLQIQCTKPKRPKNSAWFKENMLLTKALESGAYLDLEQLAFLADNGDTIVLAQASKEILTSSAFQTDDLDAFDSDCYDVSSAKAVLMANLSSYDSDVLLKVPFHDTNIENDMSYQSVQETQCSEQPFVDNDTEIDITSDSNIISYEQYLQETENPVVQNTISSTHQDELLIAVIEEMSSQVAKCNKVQQENLIVHETLTAKLERYKEQVKLFEQRQKFDLNDREKYIDGQLIQVIVDRNAKVTDFEKQTHSLKLQLNATVESHKTLSTTVECLKKESKKKENKYLDEIIDLQNKKKDLDNLVYKIGQSTQTLHMLMKPQAFYDESHKTTHAALSVTDTEETFELAEESRLKMLAKQNDPSLKEKKNRHIGYLFQNLFLKKPPVPSEPVFPRKLPSISLVKDSFHKMKEHVNKFGETITFHTKITGNRIGSWGVKHIKEDFEKDVKPFAQTLKKYFCMFEHGLNVLHANNNAVEHDNSALELLNHENDRLMELLISQDLVHTAVNSLAAINDYKSMQQSFVDKYNETLVLKAELAKKNDMIKKAVYNELSKQYDFFIINELQSQLKAKNVSIEKLKEHIANSKGKNVHNRDAHVKYLKHTQENADTLREIIEHARELRPLDSNLDSACKFVTRIKELLVYVNETCASTKPVSNKLVVVTPMNMTRKVRYLNDVNARVKPKFVKSRSAKSKRRKCGNLLVKFTLMLDIPGNLQLGNVTILMVYYVEGLRHNLFYVGQFCDLDLEVAFRKHTCYVRNLDGDGLLFGSRDINLYTISLDYMLKSSPISKQGLVRGLPKLKFKKDHLCSACSLGKSKKSTHKPKADDTNQEKLYLLHMDMCGPMRVDKAVNTTCYTQNKSLIRLRYNKIPYELMHDKKLDLSYLHVFGSLCYPTNDSEDLGKLKAKADIGIFVGYALAKKAFCIYNKRTQLIMETIHVTFDELTSIASEQFSSRPAP